MQVMSYAVRGPLAIRAVELEKELKAVGSSYLRASKDKGGSQRDKDSSPNLSFKGRKQREMELEECSARVSWYETQLLIGQPNGFSPKLFF